MEPENDTIPEQQASVQGEKYESVEGRTVSEGLVIELVDMVLRKLAKTSETGTTCFDIRDRASDSGLLGQMDKGRDHP